MFKDLTINLKDFSTKELALKYAEEGYKVFPCDLQKRPLTRNGFKDASSDLEVVRKMFSNCGDDVLIGGTVGKGFFVWDVDIDKKDFKIDLNTLPKTGSAFACVISKSGGFHFYYKVDEDVHIPTKIKVNGFNLDIKGNNESGYIIFPDDRYYKVKYFSNIEDSFPPVELNDLIKTRGNKKVRNNKTPVRKCLKSYKRGETKAETILRKKGYCKEVLDSAYNDLNFQVKIIDRILKCEGRKVDTQNIFMKGATETFQSLISTHVDNSPSTRFARGTDNKGYATNTILYVDYSNHLGSIPSPKNETGAFSCDIIHLYYHLVTGKFKLLSKYEKSTWFGRMLFDLGFKMGPTTSKIREFHTRGLHWIKGLDVLKNALEKIGVRFSFNLNEYDDGTIPLSRNFLVEWCGISQQRARALMSFLVRSNQLGLETIVGMVRIYKYNNTEQEIKNKFWELVIGVVWGFDSDSDKSLEKGFWEEYQNSNWHEFLVMAQEGPG